MKKFTGIDAAALIIWLMPLAYLVFTYSSLSATVPMHYGIDGKPDRYGSKSEFLIFQLIMELVALLIYLLMKFLPAIDPKKQVKYGQTTFQKLALGVVTFLSALNIVIIFSTLHHEFKIDKLILPAIGLLFAFIGNMMNSIKPNYFAGIRTPWTLESEETWRATHRLAGKLWFIGGIVVAVLALLLSPQAAIIVFMSGVGILAIVPIVYSYVYFKKHKSEQNL